MTTYSQDFYAGYRPESSSSARKVLSAVLDASRAESVVDVGCGIGTWLASAQELGVRNVVGIDGAYVDEEQLLIPKERFYSHDLRQPLSLPEELLPAGGRFGLAISVEVAEHLPEAVADAFVAALTALSDVVLFSAAVPYQGGTSHVNEQWPLYWAQKFDAHGYCPVDLIRPKFWSDDEVAYYYAQNGLVYIKRERLVDFPELARDAMQSEHWSLACVHPARWLQANDYKRVSVKFALMALPYSVRNVAAYRSRRALARLRSRRPSPPD